jgi:hypothetical protein
MQIQPQSLNIPLQRTERWGRLLLFICIAITGATALVSPSFATAFAASAIIGLPALYLLIFPSGISSWFSARGESGRIFLFLVLFGYIALARKVLVPFLIELIERVLY